MSRSSIRVAVIFAVTGALAGCGAQGRPQTSSVLTSATVTSSAPRPLPQAHPQAIEPAAGVQGSSAAPSSPASSSSAPSSPAPSSPAAGEVNARAPSLAEVKRELTELNLCGGTSNSAEAQPVIDSSGPGFVADPGTSQTEGQLPELTAQLNALGTALGVTIYGISGYRTPAHSVAVGGYADDPHTKGEAEDIGVNSLLRSSAAQISEAELARFGLYRPFDPSDDPHNPEVNHVQLIPAGGPLPPKVAATTWDPDPSCR